MRLIQKQSTPLLPKFSVRVQHDPSKSLYCRRNDTQGNWFAISFVREGSLAYGNIDGIFDCGRKVWGPIDFSGKMFGNVALLRFDAGWSDNTQMADALVVSSRERILWRTLTDISVESYVPREESLPVVNVER